MRFIDNSLETERDMAQWLVEAGRRTRRSPGRLAAPSPPAAPARTSRGGDRKRALLFAVLAAAYFQYFYLDTLLEITSLRSIIVFVVDTATRV